MTKTKAGTLLLSEPFLKDPNFSRSVILLCEHNDEGSFGFVLNKPYNQQLHELMPDIAAASITVYQGGPVGLDTLHFLHRRPDLIEGGIEIINNIFWGGNFSTLADLLNLELINPKEFIFFIGYSGWEKDQLEQELAEKTWITTAAEASWVFKQQPANLWKEVLKNMGGEFAQFANYPIDPQLN